MAIFILVHAAWGGGWEWRRVARALQAHGHEVFTPTLTGLGERAHLCSREVSLDTHIEDVVAMMACEDLDDVILCGHSYAGMVITGVMDRVPNRVSHAIYIDGVIPANGQALIDLLPAPLAARMFREPAERLGDGWFVPVPFQPNELGMAPRDATWYLAKLVPQPMSTFEQQLTLQGQWLSVQMFTYIYCVERSDYLHDDNGEPIESFAAPFARWAKKQGWRYREIATGHDPQITDPEALALLLQEAATTR